MQIKRYLTNTLISFLITFTVSGLHAQSVDGWYKVFTGKMGDYTATLHLHKTAKNYSGYLWFLENQWPMQLYYNPPSKKTDSLVMTADNGPVRMLLSGMLRGDSFTGMSQVSNDDGLPQQAEFELRLNTEKTITPFKYYYTEGFAKLPPQLKNQSDCHYIASAIWPVNDSNVNEVYKNDIRQLIGIKSPADVIGEWLIDEKNRYTASWKNQHSKLAPQEASTLGLSLTLQEELRVLVMYENEKYITLARYNYAYTGGTHGTLASTLSTFDKQNGKKLKLTDVINTAGLQLLPKLLEQAAKLQYNIKNNKPLNQNGFLVAKIKPSQNFYITDNGIGFIYAPNSIKSFAQGEINLLVPFTSLKGYLQKGIGTK